MRLTARATQLFLAAMFVQGVVSAEAIRLKDKTKLSGDILQVNDDDIIIRLPREQVSTINGEPLPPPIAEGAAAPVFSAKDMAGNTQSVGPGKAKATLLHFWVHWCPHCRSDSPHIQAIYDQYKNDPNVKVITVNLDNAKQKPKVEALIKERGITYPVILTGDPANKQGESGDIQDLYQITGFPATFLIDGRGIIRYKRRGSFAEGGEDLGEEIKKLLSGAAS